MLLSLLWLAVPAYVILQAIVLWRSAGVARILAGVPLLGMIPVFVYTVMGLINNSNLWPLLLLFSSPVALLYVSVAAIAIRRSVLPPNDKNSPQVTWPSHV
jgi:hypothetical protein